MMSTTPSGARSSWLIGSSAACDIPLSNPVVSGTHCRLTEYDQGFVLEDLGSTNGTWIDGSRLAPHQQVVVSPQQNITLGRTVALPWPRTQSGSSAGMGTGRVPVSTGTVISGSVPSGYVSSGAVSSGATASRSAAAGSGFSGHTVTIGRSPASDVVLDYPMISSRHAVIESKNGQFFIQDTNSLNGTAINSIENRIVQQTPLRSTDEVFLGSFKVPAARLLTKFSTGATTAIGEASFQKVPLRGDSMIIGRDPACEQPLDFPMISWRHARITRGADGMYVEDLGSRNGTFVDGRRISGQTRVQPGQQIGLGSFRFQLLEGGELAKREYYGNVTIEAEEIVVNAPNGMRLLDPVSFTIFPSELVALMGPAGAGKTTLLKALNGYTPPGSGNVLFNGTGLYQYYDMFSQQMGYVPQDDIVHPQLTVREALYYSARLRTDLTDREIEARIDSVLDDLGIPDKKHSIIGSPEKKVLSGGQRKRVNIALELINDTPVLFLDEPTSGLSSYDAEGVVKLLKRLSREGKTIITTIHQPSLEVYRQFDDLLMISRDSGGCGAMVFFGPAFPDSIEFFAKGDGSGRVPEEKELNPEMLLSGLAKAPTEHWRSTYVSSQYQKQFVEDRAGKQPPADANTSTGSGRRGIDLKQWFTLARRNVIVRMRDRMQSAILLLQAPIFAVLITAVYGRLYELSAKAADNPDPLMSAFFTSMPRTVGIHFLMVVAAIWFGCNNAARDVVGEWTVYQRERMVSLRLPSYVFSKMSVLAVICLIQCGLMLGIVYPVCGLKSGFLVTLFVLWFASLVGASLGLCISSFSRTTESAIALLPVVLLPVIALGGGMRPIYDVPAVAKWATNFIPSRWAFEANLLNEAKNYTDNGKVVAFPMGDRPKETGDLAEMQMPDYTSDDKRAAGHPGDRSNRHEFVQSLLPLAAMLVALLSGVLISLRSRDVH
jgi:ABC-type multidrug transport system ATPase subunit/pSer/pThr/pTyr-binding forkhead associated (FHA) protein